MGRFIPPDHSKGDPNTIGGYRAVHDRPAAFEGSDGASYSVEIVTDETGDAARPFAGYLLFVRWGFGDPVASGHLETEYLSYGSSEGEARRVLGEMSLSDARAKLDALIRGDKSGEMTWWDAMRREGRN
jgi:hypothetical protein